MTHAPVPSAGPRKQIPISNARQSKLLLAQLQFDSSRFNLTSSREMR